MALRTISKGATRYRLDTTTGLITTGRGKNRRSYDSTGNIQLNHNWISGNGDANSEVRSSIKKLRNHCRSLERDDELTGRFLAEFVSDVIGENGFRLESLAADTAIVGGEIETTPDETAQAIIEEAWADWQKPENCTVAGDMDYCSLKSIQERAWVRDGNNLLRLVPGFAGNKYRFAVQQLEADRIDIDHNASAAEGRGKIVMGKELDGWGKTTHFHLLGAHPGESYSENGSRTRTRIPADSMVHRFFRTRAEQVFGAPLMTNAISGLRHLGEYKEAEVVAARAHASAVFGIESDYENDDPDDDGNLDDFELNTGGILDPGFGKKASLLQPGHPNSNFESFQASMSKGIASALLTSYPTLAQDFGGVSYSSLREANLSQRKLMRCFRRVNIALEEARIFRAWLYSALIYDTIGLPFSKFEKFEKVKFHGAGFPWVDPKKEADGLRMRLEMGFEDPFAASIEHTGMPLPDLIKARKKARAAFESAGEPLPEWLVAADVITGNLSPLEEMA